MSSEFAPATSASIGAVTISGTVPVSIAATVVVKEASLTRATITKVYFNTGIAPHARTSRWSYTVPAARRAKLMFLEVRVDRDAVAVAGALAYGTLTITPSGGAASDQWLATVYGNVVDSSTMLMSGYAGELQAGDVIAAFTGDASNGGTFTYVISATIEEYDV